MTLMTVRPAMVAAAIAGALALVWLAGETSRRGAAPFHDNPTIGVEIATIWAPQKLIDFAKSHDPLPAYDELEKLIRTAGLSRSWYALTYRFYRENGDVDELSQFFREKDWFASQFDARSPASAVGESS